MVNSFRLPSMKKINDWFSSITQTSATYFHPHKNTISLDCKNSSKSEKFILTTESFFGPCSEF